MSEMVALVVAGLAIGLLAVGRLLRLRSVRKVAGGLAFLAVAAVAAWVVRAGDIHGRWEESSWVAVLLAVGYLVIRLGLLVLFEWLLAQRMGVVVPMLARDVVALVLYLLVAAAVLRAALGIEVGALLATSAVVTVVVGLALQETLGTLLAGLALAWERRIDAGDWAEIDGVEGEVKELGWRSLLLRTRLGEFVAIPNSQVAKSRLRLLGRGHDPVALVVELGVSYGVAPHDAKSVLLRALEDVPELERDPPPEVMVKEFADSAIVYRCRVWTRVPWKRWEIVDGVLTTAWAALRRTGMEVPFPQRTVHMAARPKAGEDAQRCRLVLGHSELFSGLHSQALEVLAVTSRPLVFAPGERVLREGDASRALFVVAAGEAAVLKAGEEIARIRAGEIFGEMAFLSNEPRRATVRAVAPLEVIEVSADSLRALLTQYPDVAKELADRMEARQRDLAVRDDAQIVPKVKRSLAGFFLESLQRLVSG